MNLKESFRYQNFLEKMMGRACLSIRTESHSLKTTKRHLKSKANPEVDDLTEVVECEKAFTPNDDVIAFMEWLVNEREKLTTAIEEAKASVDFNINAAIETNKFRQRLNDAIKEMLTYSASKKIEQGRDYKFNAEGNQTPYYYDVEITTEEAYARDSAKKVMKDMASASDRVSNEIDAAMVNTVVNYEPVYDINETFDDVIAEFVANR